MSYAGGGQAISPVLPLRTGHEVASPQRDAREGDGVAYIALVTFTVILLLTPQNRLPFLKPLRIAFLAAGLAAASLLWNRWRYRISLGFNREIVVCFALLSWAFMTLPLSYWPGGSLRTLTELYVKAVIVFWLLANVITTAKRLRTMAIVLMCCTVPLSYTAVKNFLTGMFITEADVARIYGYDGGLAANPNDLALMLNLLLPLTIATFVGATRKSVRFISLGVIGLNVLGIIVTFSRAGFLALAATGGVYFLRFARRPGSDRIWAAAMLAGAIIAIPFLPSTYIDRITTVTSIESDTTGSSQIRWRDTVAAARFVMEHPVIGAGIGMDILALNTVRGEEWMMVHNVYFQYAVDLGLPGIVLFLALLYGVYRAASTSRRRLADDPQRRDLFLLAEALEISLIVFALSGPFYPVAYHFYFYYMAGLALAARAVTDDVLSKVTP